VFSILKNGIQTGIMGHYSVNHGAISVYYDKADEFNASLDILLDDRNPNNFYRSAKTKV
jgi:hypothetical protein